MDVTLGFVLAHLGGALAVGLGGIGSAVGVGIVGRQSAGVMSEDPEKFGKLILLVALPGTQGIYGFLGWFLLWGKVKEISMGSMTSSLGLSLLVACLPVAVTCLVSGIHQGKVCAGGASMAAKHPEATGKALIFGALVETYAVLGLIATILILSSINVPVA